MAPDSAHTYALALKDLVASGIDHQIDYDGQHVAATIECLPELMRRIGMTKPFVVVDNPALKASGLAERVWEILHPFGPTFYDDYTPNPRSEDCAEAALRASRTHSDGVIAIGGGSCCDVAKVASLACHTPSQIRSLSRGGSTAQAMPAPLIAIPTTSGTGSEATHFAAVYVDKRKVSIADQALRPLGVVLDRRFHEAMPQYVSACSGLDALGQAMESLWAVGSTDESLTYARIAGPMIAASLRESAIRRDPNARSAMMIGSHLAGKAINISKTTAAHALSYQFTQELGLAHGHAVALTLGLIATCNAEVGPHDCLDARGPEFVLARLREASGWLGTTPETLQRSIENLLSELGLPASISEIRIAPEVIERFARDIDPVRLGNNPRRLDFAAVLSCLRGHANAAHVA